MDKPLITVITVCYNSIDTIEKTIMSVLSQTYTNIEYIIVDGASTDGTVEVIKRYKDLLSAFVSEPDKGIYDAMNKAIAMSHGKWVNFINSGDTFVNNQVIENVFSKSYNDDVKVIYGDVVRTFSDQGTTVQRFDNLKGGTIQYNLNHQSTFADGDTIRALKFDLKYRLAADANFFNEVYKHGGNFQYVPIVISNYDAVDGASAKQLITLFNEYADIKGLSKCSLRRIWGHIKMRIQVFLMEILPQNIYNKLIHLYVDNVVVKKTSKKLR
ncbi:MAG: glycosyltransferase [Bacteroidales bacterium]|nr:glycosyltransferase [Bacteroidales bacterium]